MTAPHAAAPSVQRLALGDFDHEIANTRRLLERVPDEQWDWRPHEKSATLGTLAGHLAGIIALQLPVVQSHEVDFMGPQAATLRPPAATTRAELLAQFDGLVEQLRAALAGVTDDATWLTPWTLRRGDHVIFHLPKVAALRAFGINHLVHHRGQLSVYLRLLNVPIPGMYGPSADEPM